MCVCVCACVRACVRACVFAFALCIATHIQHIQLLTHRFSFIYAYIREILACTCEFLDNNLCVHARISCVHVSSLERVCTCDFVENLCVHVSSSMFNVTAISTQLSMY